MAEENLPYVVRDGDYLASIAHSRGVNPKDVWELDANEDLRKKRPSPDMLAPGDVLFLPVVKRKWIALDTGSNNALVATVPTVSIKLNLRKEGDDGKNLLSGNAYVIQGLPGGDVPGTFGDDGAVEFRAPVSVRQVTIVSDELGLQLPVRVGGLDPIETDSGLAHRLANLGYSDQIGGPDGAVAGSLMAFQKDQGLEESGTLDDATSKALVAAHGS